MTNEMDIKGSLQPSMKDLQKQVNKRADAEGNEMQGPRLAQQQRPQAESGQSPVKSNMKWLVPLMLGGTAGAAGILTYYLNS